MFQEEANKVEVLFKRYSSRAKAPERQTRGSADSHLYLAENKIIKAFFSRVN